MRNPESVLNSLAEHSKLLDYKYERLYRILFNEEMYYEAYQRIYAKPGNMTQGSDGLTIDEMSLKRIDKLIGAIRMKATDPVHQGVPTSRRKTGKDVRWAYRHSMTNWYRK